VVSPDLSDTAATLGSIFPASGFCYTSKHSPENEFVQRKQGIPIHIAHQPAGVVDSRLMDFCSGVSAFHIELQPSPPAHLHFGAKQKFVGSIDGLHSPAIDNIACPEVDRIASSSLHPHAANKPV